MGRISLYRALIRSRLAPLNNIAYAALLATFSGCTPVPADGSATCQERAPASTVAELDLALLPRRVLVDLSGSDSDTQLRIVGALRLLDGGVVIADAASNRLIYYTVGGAVRTTVHLDSLRISPQLLTRINADTLALLSGPRVALFDGNARLLRYFDSREVADLPPGIRLVLGVLSGGGVLVGVFRQHFAPGKARRIDSMAIAIVEPSMRTTSLGPYPAVVAAVEDSLPRQVWFAPHAVFASADSTFYYGFGDRYRIERFAATGERTCVITRTWQQVAVTKADISAFIEGWSTRWITRKGVAAETQKREMQSDPFSEYVPAFSQFLAAPSGELWVRTPNLEDAQWNGELNTVPLASSSWSVFDVNGQWRALVKMPGRFLPTDLRSDYVIGIQYGARRPVKLIMYDLPVKRTGSTK